MATMKHLILFFISFMIFALPAMAQQVDWIRVQKINIEGNKKTRTNVILRELNLHEGDSVAILDIARRLEEIRLRVMNTAMFTNTVVNLKDLDLETHKASVLIKVYEPFYVWSTAYIELADRNFNVWLSEKKASLGRVNFALNPVWRNPTGRRDYLKGILQLGYTKKLELEYVLPAFDNRQHFGWHSNIYYTSAKEVVYNTNYDKPTFYFDEKKGQLNRFRIYGGLSYRPRLESMHRLRLQYENTRIGAFTADSLNRNFLGSGKTEQRFASLEYHFTFDRRDIIPYPEHGSFTSLTVEKEGFSTKASVNTLYVTAFWAKYLNHKKWSFESIAKARKELIGKRLPYLNNQALGYGQDFLRGYEYYVIDGSDYAYWKGTLRFKFFQKKYDIKAMMPIEKLKKYVSVFPIRAFLTLQTDIGYVNNRFPNPLNSLVNKPLYSIGFGAAAVFYHDDVVELEFSNRLVDPPFAPPLRSSFVFAPYLRFRTPFR